MTAHAKIGSVILALATGLILTVVGCKQDTDMPFSDCPIAVRNVITTNAPGATFTKVEKETKDDGRVVYEAKGKQADGKEIEVKVTADGQLIKFDR